MARAGLYENQAERRCAISGCQVAKRLFGLGRHWGRPAIMPMELSLPRPDYLKLGSDYFELALQLRGLSFSS
jgi:hypothetical protein